MLLTVTTEDDNLYSVEVEDDATVASLKSVVEFHSGVPSGQQQLWHHNKELQNSAQLSTSGVVANDLILLKRAAPGGQQRVPGMEAAFESLRNNQQILSQLPPSLREGVLRNDPQALQQILQIAEAQQQAQRQAEIDALNENEFDLDAQTRIAEQIRQQNIEANVDAAMEHSPEVFGEVVMLYVKLHVNNVPLNAFIDSGAQRCVMSLACAERCNIAHLIDKRFRSISHGVGGTQADVGRVHSVSVKVGSSHIPMAVTVLEKLEIDFLFGLDMLRRHRCSIDLTANCLTFGSLENTRLEFLPEHEIPKRHVVSAEDAAALTAGSSQPSAAAGAAAAARAAATPTLPPPTVPAPVTTQPPAQAAALSSQSQQGNEASADMEAKLTQLMGFGFTREQSIQALNAAGGSLDHAAAILFGG